MEFKRTNFQIWDYLQDFAESGLMGELIDFEQKNSGICFVRDSVGIWVSV